MNHTILKVLVGSRATGLAREDSDYDYRSIYITPTSELLKIGHTRQKGQHKIEKTEDDSSWELEHFFYLATKSNPSILEAFIAPVENYGEEAFNDRINCLEANLTQRVYPLLNFKTFGERLRELFPHVWSSKGVFNAFIGYSRSQHKRMVSKDLSDIRRRKYAVAYLRTLKMGTELLKTGTMTMECRGEFKNYCLSIYNGEVSELDILSRASMHKMELEQAYEQNPNKETNLVPINEFLLGVRRKVWE